MRKGNANTFAHAHAHTHTHTRHAHAHAHARTLTHARTLVTPRNRQGFRHVAKLPKQEEFDFSKWLLLVDQFATVGKNFIKVAMGKLPPHEEWDSLDTIARIYDIKGANEARSVSPRLGGGV